MAHLQVDESCLDFIGFATPSLTDDGDLEFLSLGQRDPLILNALALAGRQDMEWLAGFIQQQAAESVGLFLAGLLAVLLLGIMNWLYNLFN